MEASFKKDSSSHARQLLCRGRLISLAEPAVMGILNLTGDSFFEGSRVSGYTALLEKAGQMLREGATFLDLGAQSTRPASERINEEEELRRLNGAVEAILKRYPEAILSIDTYSPRVAKYAIEAGAAIINDISGGGAENEMIHLAGNLKVPYICMHLHGQPETMHERPDYSSIVRDLIDYFIEKFEVCRVAGVHDVIIDPGFGFSKNATDNFILMNQLENFHILGKPLLVGISRKGTIYKTLGVTAEKALNGTTVLNTVALTKGAAILRVHDVKEAVEVVKLVSALRADSLN